MSQLFAKYPDLSEFFDLPDASVPQRAACFELLAHCRLMDTIYETFAAVLYEELPSLDKEEKDVLTRTRKLFTGDAPAWVLEINEAARLLPSRIFDALPEPLHRGGFTASDGIEIEVIRSAATELSNLQGIQALCGKVLDQQLQRFERRWAAARPVANPNQEIIVRGPGPSKRKGQRTHDKQRALRDKTIDEIDDAAETMAEFLKLMDERKVKPQPTWSEWRGSWREAYKNPRLRELIHKDKSRALARVRKRRAK